MKQAGAGCKWVVTILYGGSYAAGSQASPPLLLSAHTEEDEDEEQDEDPVYPDLRSHRLPTAQHRILRFAQDFQPLDHGPELGVHPASRGLV